MHNLETEDWPKPASPEQDAAFWRDQARWLQRMANAEIGYDVRPFVREFLRASREKRAPDIEQLPRLIAPFPAEWDFSYGVLERLAIRTVDGGMSDTEALEAEQLGNS